MNSRIINKIIFMVVFFAFGLTGSAFAKMSTFEGTLQGVNCVIHNETCPSENNYEHLQLEADFVLLTDDGEYYFLPNVKRPMKIRHATKQVKIRGELKGQSIVAGEVLVKSESGYDSVWNWSEVVKNLTQR